MLLTGIVTPFPSLAPKSRHGLLDRRKSYYAFALPGVAIFGEWIRGVSFIKPGLRSVLRCKQADYSESGQGVFASDRRIPQ